MTIEHKYTECGCEASRSNNFEGTYYSNEPDGDGWIEVMTFWELKHPKTLWIRPTESAPQSPNIDQIIDAGIVLCALLGHIGPDWSRQRKFGLDELALSSLKEISKLREHILPRIAGDDAA